MTYYARQTDGNPFLHARPYVRPSVRLTRTDRIIAIRVAISDVDRGDVSCDGKYSAAPAASAAKRR